MARRGCRRSSGRSCFSQRRTSASSCGTTPGFCLRDRDAAGGSPARPGVLAAITRREGPGLDAKPRGTHDRPAATALGQALEQAGVRPSQRHRKVGDYVLEKLVGDAIIAKLPRVEMVVPRLWHLEIANVLLQSLKKGRCTDADVTRWTTYLSGLPIVAGAHMEVQA